MVGTSVLTENRIRALDLTRSGPKKVQYLGFRKRGLDCPLLAERRLVDYCPFQRLAFRYSGNQSFASRGR
jgi:hypothetical protein